MKKASCFLLVVSVILISSLFFTGCSGAQEKHSSTTQKHLSSFTGLWGHQSHRSDDKKNILYIGTDADGRIYAQYFKQYYSYQPVFLDSDFENEELLLKFKLVTYYSGSETEHEILYRLKEEEGKLTGQHCPSWEECKDVELTRVYNN